MTVTADHLFAEDGEIIDSKPAEPTGRYDRYVLPDGPKMEGREFTRTTTISGGLKNMYGIGTWQGWRTLWGLAQRDDLVARLRAVPVDDKDTIKDVAATAALVGGVEAASNLGTAVHSVLQRVDLGEDESTIHPYWHPLIANYRAELAAKGLTAVPQFIERVCRNTVYDIAGKFDNVYAEACGALVIGDKKTKDDLLKDPNDPAMQEAIYANASLIMNYETGRYEPMPNVRKDYAVIVQINPETFEVNVVKVDILHGWACVRVVMESRELAKRKHIITPYLPEGNWTPQPDAVAQRTAAMLNGGQPSKCGCGVPIRQGFTICDACTASANGKPDPVATTAIENAVLQESHARVAQLRPEGAPVVQPGTVGPHHPTEQPPRVTAPGVVQPAAGAVDAAKPLPGEGTATSPAPEAEAQEIAEQYKRAAKSELQAYAKRYGITDLAHHKIYLARLIVIERNKRRAAGLPGCIDDASHRAVTGEPDHPSSLEAAGLGNPPAEPPGQSIVGPGTNRPVLSGIDAQPQPDPGLDLTTDQVIRDIKACREIGQIGAVWQRWTAAYGPDSWSGPVKEAADAQANFIQQAEAQRAGEPGDVPF